MDLAQVAIPLITGLISASAVKGMDLFIERWRRGQRLQEEKATKLLAHLKDLDELATLYRFLTREEHRLVKDEHGEIVLGEDGKPIVMDNSFLPNPRIAKGIAMLKGADVEGLIAHKVAAIEWAGNEVLDIASDLDKSGALRKDFTELYHVTTRLLESSIQNRNFAEAVKTLREASEMRRKLRSKIEAYLR